MPELNGVSHVDLTVRDADRSVAWYEQVLGLRKVAEQAAEGSLPRVLNLMDSSGFTLGLAQHRSGDDEPFSELRVGLDHLSFSVASRDELVRWVEHLDSCGVQHSGISDQVYRGIRDSWSTSVLVFRDPDNIQLELMAVGTG